MADIRDDRLTRRQVLRVAAAGTGALILAGCGASGSATTTSTKPKRGGTFRWGASDSSSTDSLDVALADTSLTNSGLCRNLYDALMRLPHDSITPVPDLAEEMTPAPDLSYWTVRLRSAEFSDGKPITADDVIFTLQRVLNPKTPGASAGLIASIDPSRLKKLDQRTVRIYLKYPDVSLPNGLTFPGTSIVPVGYDPRHPVGSGPFKPQSFQPGVRAVLVRNDNYWQSGKPYLDQLEMIGFADPNTTRINALTSGQLDGADAINFSLVPEVQAAGGLNVLIDPSAQYITWEMRMDMPPFDDVRVRQAMKLIANRPQIVEQVYTGSKFAVLGNDLPSFTDPLYDHSIPQRVQDIGQAKSLLRQAGKEGLTVTLDVSPITGGVVEMAQVLAQQAKAAGVTINVNNMQDPATYYVKAPPAPFKMDYFGSFSMFNELGFALLPGATYNISAWQNAKWLSLVQQARGTLDFAKRKELMADAQTIFWNEGTQAIFAFAHDATAWSKKFAGVHSDVTAYSLNGLFFDEIYQV